MIALLLIVMIMNYFEIPQWLPDKRSDSSNHKQPHDQQDFGTCLNKSLDKILNSYLNFTGQDPISHCYDQLFKGNLNNGNGTQNVPPGWFSLIMHEK